MKPLKPYTAKLFVKDIEKIIYKSIVTKEEESFKKGRCFVKFSHEDEFFSIDIFAEDLSSFRSAVDHILRLIKVVEECEKLKL